MEAERRSAGISSFVSIGNKADVSGNDMLCLWADDESTNVVLLYFESFGDPVRFARVARVVSRRKPVVALKSGRSAPGRRGDESHTAALASDQVRGRRPVRRHRVLRARTLEELMDVGLLLDRHGTDRAPDRSHRQRRRTTDPRRRCRRRRWPRSAGAVGSAAAGRSPGSLQPPRRPPILSTCPRRSRRELAAVVKAVAVSGEVDACLIVCAEIDVHHRLDDIDSLLAADDPAGVPLALTLIGTADCKVPSCRSSPRRSGRPRAMAIAAQRAEWLATVVEEDDERAEPGLVVGRGAPPRESHIDTHGDTAGLDQSAPSSCSKPPRVGRRRGP